MRAFDVGGSAADYAGVAATDADVAVAVAGFVAVAMAFAAVGSRDDLALTIISLSHKKPAYIKVG